MFWVVLLLKFVLYDSAVILHIDRFNIFLKRTYVRGYAIIKKVKKCTVLTILFPLMHLSYGAGMIWGLGRYFKGREDEDAGISVTAVDMRQPR